MRRPTRVQVQRVEVDDLDALFEHNEIPIINSLLPTADELDGRINELQCLAPLVSGLGVCEGRSGSSSVGHAEWGGLGLGRTVFGRGLPDLPRAPDLVSECNVLDFVGYWVTILATLVGPKR